MFPIRKLLRLTLYLSFLYLSAIFLISNFTSFLTTTKSCTTSSLYFTDDYSTFKSRLKKEFHFQSYLANLTKDQIASLSKLYRRDVSLQLSGSRRLLPPSKPLYDLGCLNYTDQDYKTQVSIVLPYYNELPVLLLRTLTTIQHRTQLRYMREILLIDDASTENTTLEVKQFVEEQKMRVRFIRNEVRLGIADSRMKGIQEAVGDVIVILDTHMEVSDYWLEPLLSILSSHPASIAVPLLDMIDETQYNSFNNKPAKQPYIMQPRKGHGYVNMFHYNHALNARAREAHVREHWEPFVSPALMGGAIAARREFLLKYYPTSLVPSMWGIENARLSFRTWLCGEGIFISPCSQVLHPNGNDASLERYFDGQGHLYVHLIWENAAEIINFMKEQLEIQTLLNKVAQKGEEQERIREMTETIRGRFDAKKCKSYEWYLDNIYATYMSWERDQFDQVGEVRSVPRPRVCLEARERKLEVWDCRGQPSLLKDPHTTGFTKNWSVRNGDLDGQCWDNGNNEDRGEITFYQCHVQSPLTGKPFPAQQFRYNTNTQQIQHVTTNRCLELVTEGEKERPLLMKCSETNRLQRWEIITAQWF